jgi:hypothetical protein
MRLQPHAKTTQAALLQPTVKNLINGEFLESSATSWIDVTNPVRLPKPTKACSLSMRITSPPRHALQPKGELSCASIGPALTEKSIAEPV